MRCSQIASHLHPLDVLQLSRVSNELRSMLLSRQSRHIWIAARKNIEPPFPDIEMAISEPKLAHLLFEQVCSVSVFSVTVSSPGGIGVACLRLCNLHPHLNNPGTTGLHIIKDDLFSSTMPQENISTVSRGLYIDSLHPSHRHVDPAGLSSPTTLSPSDSARSVRRTSTSIL